MWYCRINTRIKFHQLVVLPLSSLGCMVSQMCWSFDCGWDVMLRWSPPPLTHSCQLLFHKWQFSLRVPHEGSLPWFSLGRHLGNYQVYRSMTSERWSPNVERNFSLILDHMFRSFERSFSAVWTATPPRWKIQTWIQRNLQCNWWWIKNVSNASLTCLQEFLS